MANADVTARKQTEAQLIARAMNDPAFRAALVADPKAVFASALGIEMPDSIDVQVLEETPTMVYLVLPQAPAQPGGELSDAELANVAGGWTALTNECGNCMSPGLPSCPGC